MNIGGHAVGIDSPVMVIAEIGVNHDGSLERAIELVRAAITSGADAVKFQVFDSSRLMHHSARFAGYQSDRTNAPDPAAFLKQFELSDADLRHIADEARRDRLTVIATPFSPEDVDRVVAMGASAIKIASPDIVNRLLLQCAARTGLPMILSTGAATEAEIESCVKWLEGRCASYALLHCISSYPTIPDDASLGWIRELARFGAPVGYSDHTDQLMSGALAVAAGACIVEKHLTYDVTADGPDHAASFDPDQFAEYVRLIRLAERMRGKHGIRVLSCENDVRSVSRQSFVLRRSVPAGHRLEAVDLTTQRPGDGISGESLDQVVGRRVRTDLPAGTMLSWPMIEGTDG